jgi:hypothetical protein
VKPKSGRLQSRRLATHHFALHDITQAYDTFEHAAPEGALKVILNNDAHGRGYRDLRARHPGLDSLHALSEIEQDLIGSVNAN